MPQVIPIPNRKYLVVYHQRIGGEEGRRRNGLRLHYGHERYGTYGYIVRRRGGEVGQDPFHEGRVDNLDASMSQTNLEEQSTPTPYIFVNLS